MAWHRDPRNGRPWCPCFLTYQPEPVHGLCALGCPEDPDIAERLAKWGVSHA